MFWWRCGSDWARCGRAERRAQDRRSVGFHGDGGRPVARELDADREREALGGEVEVERSVPEDFIAVDHPCAWG